MVKTLLLFWRFWVVRVKEIKLCWCPSLNWFKLFWCLLIFFKTNSCFKFSLELLFDFNLGFFPEGFSFFLIFMGFVMKVSDLLIFFLIAPFLFFYLDFLIFSGFTLRFVERITGFIRVLTSFYRIILIDVFIKGESLKN